MIIVDARGKAAVMDDSGEATPEARQLLAGGARVIGVDLLYQGDAGDGKRIARQPFLPGEQAHCGWTYCYNLPVFAKRVHDILAVIQASARSAAESDSASVSILATGRAAILSAAAIAQSQGLVESAALDTQGFRFGDLTDVYDIDFLPGAVKYGDVPGLLSLCGPTRLSLAGETELPPIVVATYQAAGMQPPALVASEDMVQTFGDQ